MLPGPWSRSDEALSPTRADRLARLRLPNRDGGAVSSSDGSSDLRAAEYVLGTLEAAEIHAVEAEAARDPAMLAAIADWESRLAPLSACIGPVAPPPDLWARLSLAVTGQRPQPMPH